MLKCKSNNVEAIARSFAWWLCTTGEANPRRITLTCWAEYNVETTKEILDQVWGTYPQYLKYDEVYT